MMAAAKNNDYALNRKKNPTYTMVQLEALAKELLAWVKIDNNIYIKTFCNLVHDKKGSWITDLASRHEVINEALIKAKIGRASCRERV